MLIGLENRGPWLGKRLAARLKTLYLGNTPASASQTAGFGAPSAQGRRPIDRAGLVGKKSQNPTGEALPRAVHGFYCPQW